MNPDIQTDFKVTTTTTTGSDAMTLGDGNNVCSGSRVVIVDDEPLNSAELEAFLRSLGYRHVVTVAPGAETLDALRDERPDLVLLDLALRQPSAFDVLGWMRTDRLLRHVPVVVITERDERPNRLRALQLGAGDYLVKPIDPTDLELRLRNTLATKFHHDRLAYTDGLTGLPNRESSLHRLDWALKFARRHNTAGAVLQIGLDRFKHINDALGPAMGDELLRAVGLRLLTCIRESDLVVRDTSAETAAQVARGDGDEFTVLLPAMDRSDHASIVATRIVESMADPFMLVGHELFVTCQVGIAVFPTDTMDKDMVLRQAKLAMRHGRAAGEAAGSGFRFYSQELNGRSSNRLTLERELHHALERNELVLHYQPKLDMASGRICGAEALVRWQHPQRGLLAPGAFIEVAEETGMIVPLGDWVLGETLRQVAAWRQMGLPPLTVAVNVSSLQLRRAHMDRTVRDALARAGLDGTSLCLELTESAIMETGFNVTSTLQAIKEQGVRLALDDFGTGYSSLSYLRRFPIDELKIDRSFVSECHAGNNSAAIITQAIIAMAHGMLLKVVAEGVETPQQLEFLRSNACDQYQGYLYSRPVPAKEFEALMPDASSPAPAASAAAPAQNVRAPETPTDFQHFADTTNIAILLD
jgi:diguanylate cyclase (GGDEF)-like protein